MQLPHLIGLCGNPKCGKSTAQRILQNRFGVIPIDDGYPLRDFAMRHFGLTWEEVHSQEGKALYTEVLGQSWQNRKILGDLGALLEGHFGEHILPWMVTRDLDPNQRYSFGSVRKTQGQFYKQKGGILIGITNPIAPPSGYEFDRFDHDIIDVWVHNDSQILGIKGDAGLKRFEDRLIHRLEEFLGHA